MDWARGECSTVRIRGAGYSTSKGEKEEVHDEDFKGKIATESLEWRIVEEAELDGKFLTDPFYMKITITMPESSAAVVEGTYRRKLRVVANGLVELRALDGAKFSYSENNKRNQQK